MSLVISNMTKISYHLPEKFIHAPDWSFWIRVHFHNLVKKAKKIAKK